MGTITQEGEYQMSEQTSKTIPAGIERYEEWLKEMKNQIADLTARVEKLEKTK